MWEREQEYKTELEQVILKAATSRLDRLASLALEDDRACYKHVMVLLEKQYRKCGTNMRGKLHLLYCVSTLLRQSRKQQGPRDRYAERLQPLTAALVVDLRLQYSAQVDKLLKLWRMEGVFSPEQLVEVESGRSALALQQTGTQSKSPSRSLTEASAQDPHMGFGDASGSGRSSAIQSHPPFAASGRAAPLVPGALPSYQQQQQAEGQDPYSADSNPNGARSAAPPPPALPPPPPASLIPPGLLGPVGPPPPGMLAPGSAAAAAAAVAGLFPQGQLGGFLGPSPGSLMQQGVFMAPIGPFGGGSMGGGMPGAMAGGMGQGMAVSVGSVMGGAMNGGMPFQGPLGPGPMPPGLGLQRPPLYPQPPMYGSQGQGHGSRGLNRFSQPSGRMPPGLGPSSGPGPGGAHGLGQGWQGRFGQEGQSAAAQPLPPPPPRPPPGSPPQGADGRGSGAAAVAAPPAAAAPAPAMNGMYKGNSWLDGNSAVVPPGLGNSSNAAGGDARAGSANSGASSAHGAAPTGHIRPSGRRSRWELERDSSDAPPAVAATAATEPVAKRPALAAEGGSGAPVHVAEAAPVKSSQPAPSPPPPRAPSPPPPPPPLPSPPRNGRDDGADLSAVPDDSGQAEAGPSPAVAAVAGQRQSGEGAECGHSALSPSPPQQQRHAEPEPAPGASTPMDTVGEEGPACGQGADDVAVADGKADPDGVSEPEERGARGAVAEEAVLGRQQQQHGAQEALMVTAGKPEAQGRGEVGEVVMRPREAAEGAAEAVEMDDGGSSSAEAVCPAARHHDSTAPATPGRLSGAAEQRESRNGASGQDEQQQEQEQQQQRSSSSGTDEFGYDGPSMTVPSEVQAAVDGASVGQAGAGAQEQLQLPQQAGEATLAEAGMSTNQLSSAERCGAQQQLAGHDVQSADQPVQQPTEAAAEAPAPAEPQSCSQSEPEPEPESQAAPGCADGAEAGLRLDMVRDGIRGVGGDEIGTGDNAPVVEAPSAAAPEAAEAPAEEAASEAALPSAPPAVADGAAAADSAAVAEAPAVMSCPAQEATVQLQSSAENDAPTSVSDRASQPADGAQPVVDAASYPPQAAQPARALEPPLPPPAQQQQQQAALQNSSTLQLSSYETSRGGGVAEELEELELGDFDESWLE